MVTCIAWVINMPARCDSAWSLLYSAARLDVSPAQQQKQQVVLGTLLGVACPADVQAYLNGVENPVFKNFFTVKTFIAKVIGSSLAVGSSLVMGKEGPMLHAGSILAVILGEASA